jgi:hypothetical protein
MDKIGNNGNNQISNKAATKFILGKVTLTVLNYKISTNLANLLVDSAACNCVLSLLDAHSGYNQVPIAEEDINKAAFPNFLTLAHLSTPHSPKHLLRSILVLPMHVFLCS